MSYRFDRTINLILSEMMEDTKPNIYRDNENVECPYRFTDTLTQYGVNEQEANDLYNKHFKGQTKPLNYLYTVRPDLKSKMSAQPKPQATTPGNTASQQGGPNAQINKQDATSRMSRTDSRETYSR